MVEYDNPTELKKYAQASVEECKIDVSKYFRTKDYALEKRFEVIYNIFGLSDKSVAKKAGVDRTTMNRYRRGVWIPTLEMKRLIAKAISELAQYPVDSSVLWGDDLIFEEWRRNKK